MAVASSIKRSNLVPPAGFEPALTAPEAGPVHGCYQANLALAFPLGSVWGVRVEGNRVEDDVAARGGNSRRVLAAQHRHQLLVRGGQRLGPDGLELGEASTFVSSPATKPSVALVIGTAAKLALGGSAARSRACRLSYVNSSSVPLTATVEATAGFLNTGATVPTNEPVLNTVWCAIPPWRTAPPGARKARRASRRYSCGCRRGLLIRSCPAWTASRCLETGELCLRGSVLVGRLDRGRWRAGHDRCRESVSPRCSAYAATPASSVYGPRIRCSRGGISE
jgi:hypothetical protein